MYFCSCTEYSGGYITVVLLDRGLRFEWLYTEYRIQYRGTGSAA